ncbi:MAG: EamA family transporter [Pseudomonadota bacterium]
MSWIAIAVMAAALQTGRLVVQKILTGSLSTVGATAVRFFFAVPFALLAVLLLVPEGLFTTAVSEPRVLLFAAAGALAQILGTALQLSLFGDRNFAVATAFAKTETVQAIGLSALVLGEWVSLSAAGAIVLGFAGVMLLSLGGTGWRTLRPGPELTRGLLSGTAFAGAAVGFRGAALAVPAGSAFERALVVVLLATVVQSLSLLFWLLLRQPTQLLAIARSWAPGVAVGAFGASASLGWFWAMALERAPLVRAVGQVEMLFAVLIAVFWFREQVRVHELLGMGLLVISILFIGIFA